MVCWPMKTDHKTQYMPRYVFYVYSLSPSTQVWITSNEAVYMPNMEANYGSIVWLYFK